MCRSVILIGPIEQIIIFVSEPTCSDTVQNQGETQVDCGGPCTGQGTCIDGDTCATSSDCQSNNCVGTTCMSKYVLLEVQ